MVLSVATVEFFVRLDPGFIVIDVLVGSFRKRPKRGPEGQLLLVSFRCAERFLVASLAYAW